MTTVEPSTRVVLETARALSWDDARATAWASVGVLQAVDLPLKDALGTTLAGALRALTAVPAFDTAAMDGYACAGREPWRVTGSLRAGDDPLNHRLLPGTAVEIATGAAVPAGTVAVLPYERAQRIEGQVRGDVEPGAHIRRAGEECRAGEVLMEAGARVTAPVLGLAAATGHDTLHVRRVPRITLLVTGDELLSSGLPVRGRVRDALGPMLPGVLAGLHAEVVELRHVGDDQRQLSDALETAGGDVLVVTGSSSAGPADHLRAVLRSTGAQLVVDGVACRPGHPQCLALLRDGRPLVGLPGNPLAAIAGTVTLLEPLLDAMRGVLPRSGVPAANGGLHAHAGATRLVPVRVRDGRAVPVVGTGSAMLRGVAGADALAVVDPGAQPPTTVRLLALPWATDDARNLQREGER